MPGFGNAFANDCTDALSGPQSEAQKIHPLVQGFRDLLTPELSALNIHDLNHNPVATDFFFKIKFPHAFAKGTYVDGLEETFFSQVKLNEERVSKFANDADLTFQLRPSFWQNPEAAVTQNTLGVMHASLLSALTSLSAKYYEFRPDKDLSEFFLTVNFDLEIPAGLNHIDAAQKNRGVDKGK